VAAALGAVVLLARELLSPSWRAARGMAGPRRARARAKDVLAISAPAGCCSGPLVGPTGERRLRGPLGPGLVAVLRPRYLLALWRGFFGGGGLGYLRPARGRSAT